ncbi:aspartyl/glutamyl-tRNA(Asn/Gln) amidotransferase subunit A [Paracoccus thiocyanatus]|uniref:Aspartyl/glutamyl-tRNA(Asn/Gln) amidotransferase subunit A n=1 Tax=Paracoccus thiocyanatus TaxID=34006 RepID=A0A1N6ZWL0_9RHOB|nr:amidase [Paracoccus thiocyanatus]SIR31195.1 aspartyl/glutamyl-tRNA(Asn/Gln) amidotransferase subunit A [Paracoccus thiocyanatus]
MDKDLLKKTMTEVAGLIKDKKVSPVEVTQNLLDYIDESNKKTNAYISVTAESALDSARQAEKEISAGNYKGVFHGVPLALKDNIYFKNEVTTMASKIHKDFVSEEDATVTERLRDAGAVFTGKLNMHEYAWGIDNNNPHFGAVHNPWNPDRVPGGSSGGSGAAVASHSSYTTLGTDTAGSIRIPSSACGLVGLKPTHGRVSKFGVFPLAWTLDHVGPMAKSVADAAAMLATIAGFDPRDPTCANVPVGDYTSGLNGQVKGLKIGINEEYFFKNVDGPVEKLIRERIADLEKQGATVKKVSIPSLRNAEWVELATSLSEASAIHHHDMQTRPEDFGADIRFLFELGELFTAVDYLQAQQARRQLKAEFDAALQEVDVLIAPTLPFIPPNIGDDKVNINGKQMDFIENCIRFTGPSNLTGLPAMTVPAGLGDGMPVGLQIIGRAFDEARVLNVGKAVEDMKPMGDKSPVLAP